MASETAFDRAKETNSLLLLYQPIHDARSGRVRAAEALLRQRRQSGEIREASAITRGVEENEDPSDLFLLNSWVVRQSYTDLARWKAGGLQDVRLNVNLSPREVSEPDLSSRLTDLLTSCGADAADVNLELTETSYIEGPASVVPLLDQVTKLGIQLWLDDFGTGFSSVEHLLHFPLSGLKIPGKYVSRIETDVRARVIVDSLLRLAHELGMQVIAEGVENETQLRFLQDRDCELIQGFLFSRPMEVDELIARARG